MYNVMIWDYPPTPITNNSHRNAKSNYIPLWALYVIPPPKKYFWGR